jgi:AcrR family transcriptional regulator
MSRDSSARLISDPSRALPRLGANKHQQKTEATRLKLLRSGRRVFAREGFEAARIEDIAAETGHTRGAFYAHFKSKEDLFFALLEQQVKEHVQKIQALLERCSTVEECVESMRDYYVARVADRQWVMLMLEFKLFAVRHRDMRAKLAQTHRRIRSSLNIDLIPGVLPARLQSASEQEELRTALEATLSGLVLENAYDEKRISEDQVVSVLRRVFDMLMESE